jgi:alkylated DNA repair dioxygenase AlkB
VRPDLSWQGSLLDDGPAQVDVSFQGLRRIQLDDTSWIDVDLGWLRGSDELFAELVQTGRWGQREVHMYEKKVIEPRLTAGWDTDVDGAEMPAALRAISASLSDRYGVTFDRIWVNLYRDGRDSVAWHGDRIGRRTSETVVALVSLGSPRRFLLRPKGGGQSLRFVTRPGDLLVLGGTCQRTWEHSVPKSKRVGPRISVMFREGY